jgi:hypothetical protein
MAAVGPDGPTKYLSTDKPNVFAAYDWNPDEDQYNLYRGLVRQEDLPKTAAMTGLRAESRQPKRL